MDVFKATLRATLRTLLIFNILICSASTARPQATEWTGNAMFPLCEPQNESSGIWYLKGIIDGYNLYELNASARHFKPDFGFMCFPNSVTAKQVYDMTCKYIREHPEQRHFPAPVIVNLSLIDTFRCK